MKTAKQTAIIPLIVAALFLQGCATTFTGKAEQSTQLAADVFHAFVTAEYQAQLPKDDPVHQYAQLIRLNGVKWLETARALTEAYRLNPTPEGERAVKQALAVVASALAQSQVYLIKLGKG